MKTIIINLHGFNSGPGDKAVELAKQFPNCVVIAPQLPYDPSETIELIKEIIRGYEEDDIHIVGTSLGAFYAMVLSTIYSERMNIYYYLINTSFEPHITLRRYKSEVITNFKTSKQFETTPQFFTSLERMYDTIKLHYKGSCIYSSNYFIGTEDEMLDFKNFTDFIRSFNVPYKIHYSKQNHRFSNIADVVRAIRYNSALFI